MNKLNLDRSAAQAAQEIVKIIDLEVKDVKPKEVENLVTKALGVLQEQGVYAAILFLLSRSGEKTEPSVLKPENLIACYIVYHLLKLLSDSALQSLGYGYDFKSNEPAQINTKKQDILFYLTKENGPCADLDHLLLIKEVYEQTLIYARFGAKAAGTGD